MKPLLLLVLVIAAVGGGSVYLLASSYTFHDPGAIGFKASLNATTILQNESLRVNVAEWNTLYFKNAPTTTADRLRSLNLSSGPCGGLFPAGIALYEGVYGLNNFSSAAPLILFAPGFYSCPAFVYQSALVFGATQNVTNYQDLTGYWTSGNTPAVGGGEMSGVLHRFQPGLYTVITGDAWGKTKVLYFRVVAITANQERSGPTSTFPNSWLNPCLSSGPGNMTTSVYLGPLNDTNLDQVYALITNSSSFSYLTTGHGWVVSGWSESSINSDTSPGPTLVVSFILTTGDRPLGYLYAYYYASTGTVALSSTTLIGSQSCV